MCHKMPWCRDSTDRWSRSFPPNGVLCLALASELWSVVTTRRHASRCSCLRLRQVPEDLIRLLAVMPCTQDACGHPGRGVLRSAAGSAHTDRRSCPCRCCARSRWGSAVNTKGGGRRAVPRPVVPSSSRTDGEASGPRPSFTSPDFGGLSVSWSDTGTVTSPSRRVWTLSLWPVFRFHFVAGHRSGGRGRGGVGVDP